MRSSAPLPQRYRVSLRVGYGHFGDGTGLKRLRLRPRDGRAVAHRPGRQQNGFYFLAILDALPRPHNNTWIHHHRKVVMDTDSNVPPWIEIWDGQRFVIDGRRPVNMLAVDGRGPVSTLAGKRGRQRPWYTWYTEGVASGRTAVANGRIFRLNVADPHPFPSAWVRLHPFSTRVAKGSIPGASPGHSGSLRGRRR